MLSPSSKDMGKGILSQIFGFRQQFWVRRTIRFECISHIYMSIGLVIEVVSSVLYVSTKIVYVCTKTCISSLMVRDNVL